MIIDLSLPLDCKPWGGNDHAETLAPCLVRSIPLMNTW